MKNKESILIIVVTVIVALLVGAVVTDMIHRKKELRRAPATAQAPLPAQNEIALLLGVVEKYPQNHDAWVQLGHAYFDSDQPAKAVDAYGKALELQPNDPDILTDQGSMYQRLGWYDQAVENFRKAQSISPGHAQSLFNLGVVYFYDLHDLPKARQAWEKYLELYPTSPGAAQIRQELGTLDQPDPFPATK